MPSLGKVGIADRGTYSSAETYNSSDFVLHNGSTWLCIKDNLVGSEPMEGSANWKYLARGFAAEMLSVITAIDTYGMVGEAGGETDAQTFMDKLADEVANKLVKKTSIVNTHSTSTETVPSSALVNELNDKLAYGIQVSDCNLATGANITYYAMTNALNIPVANASNWFIIRNFKYSDGGFIQKAWDMKADGREYYRYYGSGTWSAWENNVIKSDLSYLSATDNSSYYLNYPLRMLRDKLFSSMAIGKTYTGELNCGQSFWYYGGKYSDSTGSFIVHTYSEQGIFHIINVNNIWKFCKITVGSYITENN